LAASCLGNCTKFWQHPALAIAQNFGSILPWQLHKILAASCLGNGRMHSIHIPWRGSPAAPALVSAALEWWGWQGEVCEKVVNTHFHALEMRSYFNAHFHPLEICSYFNTHFHAWKSVHISTHISTPWKSVHPPGSKS
jgi:hypothetical protein